MKIRLNTTSVYQCEGVRLLPGVNELDKTALERLLKNPMVQADIEIGRLEVVDKPKAEKPKTAPAPAPAPAQAPAAAPAPAPAGQNSSEEKDKA